ncbi:MAG: MarC family protein [Candidatus Binatia bacterium]
MDESLLQFFLRAFVTLFVVVDPLGVAPNFVALTSEFGTIERKRTLRRALIIAFGVTLFFLVAGRWLLDYLGVTVHAFAISGGILLFAASWSMLFGHRPGLQAAPEHMEHGMTGEDIAVFPLAIPLLSGPGTITSILLLTNHPDTNALLMSILTAIVVVVYLISWFVLYAGERIIMRLGEGKVRIMTRVLGIILAALAVQFVLNGIGGFYDSLIRRPA